jgi:hypothetical protein
MPHGNRREHRREHYNNRGYNYRYRHYQDDGYYRFRPSFYNFPQYIDTPIICDRFGRCRPVQYSLPASYYFA